MQEELSYKERELLTELRGDSQIDFFMKDVKLKSYLNLPTSYQKTSHRKNRCKAETFEKRTIPPIALPIGSA